MVAHTFNTYQWIAQNSLALYRMCPSLPSFFHPWFNRFTHASFFLFCFISNARRQWPGPSTSRASLRIGLFSILVLRSCLSTYSAYIFLSLIFVFIFFLIFVPNRVLRCRRRRCCRGGVDGVAMRRDDIDDQTSLVPPSLRYLQISILKSAEQWA